MTIGGTPVARDLRPGDHPLDELGAPLDAGRDLRDAQTITLHVQNPPLDGSEMFDGVAHAR